MWKVSHVKYVCVVKVRVCGKVSNAVQEEGGTRGTGDLPEQAMLN